MESDDAYWRRPEPGADEAEQHSRQRSERPSAPARGQPRAGAAGRPAEGAAPRPPVTPGYQGPPRAQAPAANWRPERRVAPPPPRALPEQDHDGIEAEEERARGITRLIAISAGAILLVLMCALCGRWVF